MSKEHVARQPRTAAVIPAGCADWLTGIKTRVQAARSRPALAANAEHCPQRAFGQQPAAQFPDICNRLHESHGQ